MEEQGKGQVIRLLAKRLRDILDKCPVDFKRLQEIRLRVGAPLLTIYDNEEYFITYHAHFSRSIAEGVIIREEDVRETMEYISSYSLYAFEDELRQGFITVQGGHRIGVAGKVIMEKKKIKTMKCISCLNIRLAHQVRGCADSVIPYIRDRTGIHHTLLISPPCCGKTTLLRDLIRQCSDGDALNRGVTIGVVDERSEIGAAYLGIPQNDLGIRTDLLDCCPKAEGMLMLVRSMSPDVIAVDEIGSEEDIRAVHHAINCGCKLMATVHGSSLEEIRKKPSFTGIIEEELFERYIILGRQTGVGTVLAILDEKGEPMVDL